MIAYVEIVLLCVSIVVLTVATDHNKYSLDNLEVSENVRIFAPFHHESTLDV